MSDQLKVKVEIYEVAPRDGLQNEATPVPLETKLQLIADLEAAGLRWIEATSFVNPKAVPQLADAAELMAELPRGEGMRYPVLVPNERGMERALEAGVDAIALFAAASEEFSQANIRASIAESFERFKPVVRMAMDHNIWIRGYVSTAFNCPYAGPIKPAQAIDVTARLLDLGCAEVAIADTIGTATPDEVSRLLDLAVKHLPIPRLAFHLHDTHGMALEGIAIAFEAGLRVFDGAASGLGGCPFAPGAPGNLATEKLVRFFDDMDVETGVDADMVEEAGQRMRAALNQVTKQP